MFRFMAASLMLLSTVADATAATQQCLKPADIEAEQAIRFQTELMVVSDTCGAQTYTRFTRRNRAVLVEYQQQMIERFRRDGSARAEARFDSYLTRLANQISLRAGAQPVAALCRDSASLLATADTLDNEKFRRYIADRAANDFDRRRCHN